MAGRKGLFRCACIVAVAMAMSPAAARAGETDAPPSRKLRAAVYDFQPFVMPVAGGYGGYAIELWERCGRNLGMETEYYPCRNFKELLEAVETGRVDIGVSGLSIVRERARRVRFSFPWYDSGFRMMTKAYTTSLWTELRHDKRFRIYLLFVGIFLVLAFLMSVVRRKKDPKFPPDWKSGFCLSLLDVLTSVRSGRIEQKYLGWLGHILSLVWLLFGMAAVTYVTSTMTTAMTAMSVDRNRIERLSDLAGSDVGVLRGGLSEAYINALNMATVPCDSVSEAAQLLAEGRIRAVVTDAPVLEYWMHTNPEYDFEFAGPLFRNDKFGFATAKQNAELMDAIDRELIRMLDSGELAALREKYFGKNE